MSKTQGPSVVRTFRGLALLAPGFLALAACTSSSSHVPTRGIVPAPSSAQGTSENDGSPPSVRTLRAPCAPASATAGCGLDAARVGAATGAATSFIVQPIVRPCSVEFPKDAACPCGRPPPPCCESWPSSKSYSIPAAEIVAFEFLLNQFDRHFVDSEVFDSDLDSILDNLSGGWTYDKDPFKGNQFTHPYGGAVYFGFARSAGLDFWESFGYAFGASFLWEIAGETDPPSINDQITTPIAGSFLGEALFRCASLILGNGCCRPSTGSEWLAALVCPSLGFNRWAFGNRFDAVYPSHDPAVFWTWSVGMRRNDTLTDIGVLSSLNRNVALGSIAIDYGLPGKSGYSYTRPFDYFHLEATATSSEHAIPENLMIRGLLVGTDTCSGPKHSGIWGLYGTYDYLSPEIFKLSSCGVSLGTTRQYLASDRFALQGSLLGGVGFSMSGTTANERAERSYRYSWSPQGMVALRAAYDDVAMLDLTLNEYFLADSFDSSRARGSENVLRAQVALTIRIFGPHAITLGFVQGRRDPHFAELDDTVQSVQGFSLSYTHLSDTHFGVVRR